MRGRRCSPVRFQRDDQSFQQISKATTVLPVPVAIVNKEHRLPVAIAWIARLMAISW